VNEDHRDAEVFLKAVGEGISGLKIEGRILNESLSLEIPILGAHQVTNLAAAALVALSAGLAPKEVIENLGRMKSPWGRMQLLKSQKGFRILFDGYNANPESMGALLSAVSSLKPTGKLCGVLAHMRELGDHAEAAHAELGRQAAALNFAKLWFYGPQNMAFRAGYLKAGGNEKNLVISDDYKDELAREMVFMLSPQDLVIVKGSRGLKTERFVLAADPLDFANK
jgi:UDP-N-acetylmuramoyl-tripeptide--D-alanyl-D-alanine ligase